MVKRQDTNIKLGKILKDHRLQMDLSINDFVNYPSTEIILEKNWISAKSVSNFEQGTNIPTLKSLKKLATAYQINLVDLIIEIEPYI